VTRRVLQLAVLVLLLLARASDAQRFAVVIGNNVGHAGDQALQFAERDATRVADVLTSVGAVQPDRLILAQGSTAQSARRSLIAMNGHIRAQATEASMLIVYYSGHGDAESLHLGSSSLPMSELEGLVRGSAARVRILIIDACRAGALVRAKGGRAAPAIRIETSAFAGDGVVLLTATAAGEDAHESPGLEGSFFTHHLYPVCSAQPTPMPTAASPSQKPTTTPTPTPCAIRARRCKARSTPAIAMTCAAKATSS
jgi:uncharacterized caspase-like protein